MAEPSSPFVFVVGCPRSGTTLLQRMLDNHPELTVANDTHFITRAAKRELRRSANPVLTPELVDKVLAYHRFRRMGLDGEQARSAAVGAQTYREFVARLYALRAARAGKRLSGEKTPDFCRRIPTLHALVPGARFVHILRDGRSTALSALSWAGPMKGPGRWSLWTSDALACCALWWQWQAGSGVQGGRAIGRDHYHELRYEDLVAHPEETLAGVAGFLGIENSPRMARFHEGKTRANPDLSAKSAWLPPTTGLRDWRRDLDREDQAVFDLLAGDLLKKLGYELSGAAAPVGVQRRVDRARAWWAEQPMSRSRPPAPP